MKSRRPTTGKLTSRRAQHGAVHGWTRWAFFLLCVFVAVGMAVPAAWARPQNRALRQTVPMTPPPTWTPSSPVGPTERPTRPQPPTSEPATPSPAGEPTRPPGARPWLGLSAEPLVAEPGTAVLILLELQNLSDGSLENATITLPGYSALSLQGVQTSLGQAQFSPDGVTWTPGPLTGHGGGILQLAAVVGPDALPGTQMLLQATLVWPGGQVQSNGWPLSLPAALLPDAGG